MSTQQALDQQQYSQMMRLKNSGVLNYSGSPLNDDKEEEMTKTALSAFRAKEEEIEKRKAEMRERVQAQKARAEEETKKLAKIHEELEALADPMRKEVSRIRKRVDLLNRDLKTLGLTCQKKEKEYKESVDAFNEMNKEKTQLISKLMELVSESEKLRMTKLEELSKNIDSLH